MLLAVIMPVPTLLLKGSNFEHTLIWRKLRYETGSFFHPWNLPDFKANIACLFGKMAESGCGVSAWQFGHCSVTELQWTVFSGQCSGHKLSIKKFSLRIFFGRSKSQWDVLMFLFWISELRKLSESDQLWNRFFRWNTEERFERRRKINFRCHFYFCLSFLICLFKDKQKFEWTSWMSLSFR